jgi:OOP family OmpA-OmpF porin
MAIKRQAAVAALVILATAPLSAGAGEGFYIGASVGSASLSEDFDGLGIDDSSTSFRIVGGWRANDYFTLEAGYQNFGDFEASTDIGGSESAVKLSADGFTLGLTGSVPLTDKFSLFGRAGMFFWDGNAEVDNASQATPEDTNPYFGVGVAYAVSEKFLLIGDWTRYELESANSSVYSVGFEFRFGQ